MGFVPFGKCLSLGEHEKMFLLFKCIAAECTLSGTKPAVYKHPNSSLPKRRKLIYWTQFESHENSVSDVISNSSTICVYVQAESCIHQITPNEMSDL